MIHIDDSTFILSHDKVPLFRKEDLTKYKEVYLHYRDSFINLNQKEELKSKRNEAIQAKEWNRAKAYNDILIDLDFLNKEISCDGRPDYLQIETTNICNAKCIMCSHYFSNNKGGSCLGNETLSNMIDAIQLSRTISLYGMGEPFISKDVCDQIDMYAKYGNRLGTNTNLSVLNDRIVSHIRDNFDWLEISCDGADKEIYESVRKNLSFETLKQNLKRLKEECPNTRKHIATGIMRQNVNQMPQMVRLAKDAGASIITFMTLNSNIIIDNSIDEMNKYPKVLEYFSVKALEEGEKLGVPVVVPNENMLNRNITFEDIKDEYEEMKKMPLFKTKEEEKKMLETAEAVDMYLKENDEIQRDTSPSKVKCSGICDWLLKKSYIDLKGNVCMCCRNQSFQLGNVNETGNFEKVWNSDFYKKIRSIFYSGYLPEACLKCGLIERGNLKYLKVDINEDFYEEPSYKVRQKETLKKILEEK